MGGSSRRKFAGILQTYRIRIALFVLIAALAVGYGPPPVSAWTKADFAHRVLVAYPLPASPDNIIGELMSYRLRRGDDLLDVGRYFDLTAAEISKANHNLDWWTPPVGKVITLPTEHILPNLKHYRGIVLNIPELRVYYFPRPVKVKGHVAQRVVYTFPVGLGRFDWKTPLATTRVVAKEKNPVWIVPQDIYEEHLERDGYAVHRIAGGDPDNPEGLFRLDLTIPEYALHGTNNPWGVGMEVSHGCVRFYPEDIEALYHIVPVGTPVSFVYQPVKFGWRDGRPYVEVHPDVYAKYPGLWSHTVHEAKRMRLLGKIDMAALERAVAAKTGIPTYIGRGNLEANAGPSPDAAAAYGAPSALP